MRTTSPVAPTLCPRPPAAGFLTLIAASAAIRHRTVRSPIRFLREGAHLRERVGAGQHFFPRPHPARCFLVSSANGASARSRNSLPGSVSSVYMTSSCDGRGFSRLLDASRNLFPSHAVRLPSARSTRKLRRCWTRSGPRGVPSSRTCPKRFSKRTSRQGSRSPLTPCRANAPCSSTAAPAPRPSRSRAFPFDLTLFRVRGPVDAECMADLRCHAVAEAGGASCKNRTPRSGRGAAFSLINRRRRPLLAETLPGPSAA